ncbi:MAG: hypothetical protein WAU70_17595 [Flavobacteriales bacterium]
MDNVFFVVGSEEYVARIEYREDSESYYLGVFKIGEERSVLDIGWEPKTNWQRFMPNDDFIRIGVVKRALKIFADFRKAEASKAAQHKLKGKASPKAAQQLQEQLKEALANEEYEMASTLRDALKRRGVN